MLDILRARRRLLGRVVRTPLVESRALSAIAGGRIFLKLESLQTTGSFKLRGAMNAVLALTDAFRLKAEATGRVTTDRGFRLQPEGTLVTASAGNHGRGLAYAAERAGIRLTVFTPRHAPRVKVDAIRRHGAEVREADTYEDTERLAKAFAADTGARFISPYSDPDIIAGAGTVGLEIIEDRPDVDTIVVPVGGGGLLSGVAIAVKTISPAAQVVGVEAAASPVFHASLRAGRIVEVEVQPTIADGLAGNMDPESITFDIVRRLVDRTVLVTDDEIKGAIGVLVAQEHLIAEGAGAAAVAAVLAGKVGTSPGTTAVIVSGGNIDAEKLGQVLGTGDRGQGPSQMTRRGRPAARCINRS